MCKINVDEKLKDMISKNLRGGISNSEIEDSTNIIEDFGFDSIQMIRLISAIEVEFDIEVDSEYLIVEKFSEFSGIRKYIEEKLENKKAEGQLENV